VNPLLVFSFGEGEAHESILRVSIESSAKGEARARFRKVLMIERENDNVAIDAFVVPSSD